MGDDTNIHALPVTPNEAAMRWFVRRLFERAGGGRIELAWTSEQYPHGVNRARMFDTDDLDALVAAAVAHNGTPNRNVYIGAGVRRPDMPHQRALSGDVIQAVACKADCDAPGALESALLRAERGGFPPNIVVFTGRTPHLRGQMWWLLDAPCAPADAEALDRALAQTLGTDSKITNPDRLMRLAGGVAWPLKEGRTLEMTGLHDADVRGERYTLEELRGALVTDVTDARDNGANILNLSDARPTLELSAMIARARLPGEWHQNALLAVAHLIGRGCPADVAVDALAPSLWQPATHSLEQTRAELVVMAAGAVAKGWARSLPSAPDALQGVAANESPFWSIDRLLTRPPPSWLIDGFLHDEGTSVLFGAPGSFKSFIALDMALCVAHGIAWHGRAVPEPCNTLYICAEGQYSFGVRGLVWRTHRALEGAAGAAFHVLPLPVNFLEPGNVARLVALIREHLGGVKFVVVDTLARNFGPGDENSAQDMGKFITGIDALRQEFAGHVMIVHHTGKDGSKDERGSIALRGGVDTAIRLDREEGAKRVKMSVRKQKDAEEAAPAWVNVVTAEAVHPVTGEVVTSLIPVLDAEPPAAPGEVAGHLEALIVTLLTAGGALTHNELTSRTGRARGAVYNALRSLFSKGILAKSRETPVTYYLTEQYQ